jgi:hypothetical protein
MDIEYFNDRRPKPDTSVKLTARQRELAQQYGIGTADEKGHLTLSGPEYRKALESSYTMMDHTSEWGKDRRGDVVSAKNLTNKVFGAVSGAIKDSCPSCQGRQCPACLYTGRKLR